MPVGAHNSVVGADQGFLAPSWDQESVRDSVHEDSASARIAAGQRPRPSFRHPHAVRLAAAAARAQPSGGDGAGSGCRVLADGRRCGAIVSLFTDADGTAQPEAWPRWHLGTVAPLAGRGSAFKALVTGGVAVTQALATSGLLADDIAA